MRNKKVYSVVQDEIKSKIRTFTLYKWTVMELPYLLRKEF
jgi:hypothetical protein